VTKLADTNTVTLDRNNALELVTAALVASNTHLENAKSVAKALVRAEIDGQPGHGLIRVTSYGAQSISGKVDGHAIPSLEQMAPALVRVDANHGFAYPAFDLLLDALPEIISKTGLAFASVHRSHHFGQAGAHCERLADQGIAAFAFSNSPGAIAPWGGRRGLFGTNPIAFAAPREGNAPLVVDLALSVGARGKILSAQRTGDQIPEGWALDEDGNPTTNPFKALPGTMLPIGGQKGAALALIVEILTAAIAGSSLAFEASSLFTGDGPPPSLSQTMIAIDVRRASAGHFSSRLETLLNEIEIEPGARLPGTKRLDNRALAEHKGITISASLHEEIKKLAERDAY
jgi:(2R)-3-sulfolactate dehydrogenase (NADP+)